MKKIIATDLLPPHLLLTSCAPKLGGSDYSIADFGLYSVSLRGYIIAVRVVNLQSKQPNEPGIGDAAGAVMGAVAGNVISNNGPFTTVAGGLLDGVAGHFIEQGFTNLEGYDYNVQLDNGQIQNVTQGTDPKMTVGQ